MKTSFYRLSIIFLLFSAFSFPQTKILEVINKVSIDSLTLFVKQLSGDEPVVVDGTSHYITTRHYTKPGKDIAGQWIKSKFESYGLTTKIDNITSGNLVTGTGKNILAIKTGSKYPQKKYVICAHYDSMPQQEPAPGADDNASGTAAVIEAARILAKENPLYTIVFAAFDEEEVYLCGSSHFVVQAIATGEQILGVINMDMISYDSNNDAVADVHTRPIGNSIAMSKTMIELNSTNKVGLVLATVNPGSDAVDSESFWAKKFTTITLLEADGDFNPFYHNTKPYDDITHINWQYYKKCVQLSLATLSFYALDGINTPPAVNFISSLPNPAYTGQVIKSKFKSADDPEDDSVSISVDWGDGDVSGFNEYISDNSEEEFTHIFNQPGTYIIKAEATDIHGIQSENETADTIIVKPLTHVENTTNPPAEFELYSNYPNPFNPGTTIAYNLPSECSVSIRIFNSLGQLINDVNQGTRQSGMNYYYFKSNNLSSGIYCYTVNAIAKNGMAFNKTGKMILNK